MCNMDKFKIFLQGRLKKFLQSQKTEMDIFLLLLFGTQCLQVLTNFAASTFNFVNDTSELILEW